MTSKSNSSEDSPPDSDEADESIPSDHLTTGLTAAQLTLDVPGKNLPAELAAAQPDFDLLGENLTAELAAAQPALDFLEKDLTDELAAAQPDLDLLGENLTAQIAATQPAPDFLGKNLTDELAAARSVTELLNEDLTSGLDAARSATELLDEDLAIGSSLFQTASELGLVTRTQIGHSIGRTPPNTEIRRERSAPGLGASSPQTLDLLSWKWVRAKIRSVLKVLPILSLFLTVKGSYERQKILTNQRENSQRLDKIERQIEAPDKERYATIVGRRSAVRLSPDSQAVITTRLRRDTQVEPITIDDGWVRIRYIADGEERYGWVAAKYLDTLDMEE